MKSFLKCWLSRQALYPHSSISILQNQATSTFILVTQLNLLFSRASLRSILLNAAITYQSTSYLTCSCIMHNQLFVETMVLISFLDTTLPLFSFFFIGCSLLVLVIDSTSLSQPLNIWLTQGSSIFCLLSTLTLYMMSPSQCISRLLLMLYLYSQSLLKHWMHIL